MGEENILEGHQVTNQLNLFSNQVKSLLRDPNTRHASELQKLLAITEYLDRRLQSVDPVLLATEQLDAISNHLNNARNHLNNYTATKTLQNINSATAAANAAIAASSNLADSFSPDGEQLRDVIVSIRRTAGQHVRNLETEVGELRSTLNEAKKSADDLLKDLTAQKGRLDKAIADFQSQFSQAEETRRENFTEDMRKWAQTYAAELDQAIESVEEARQLLEGRFEKFEAKISEEANSHLEDLRRYKADAEKLVGVIGTTGTAYGFDETARSSAQSAANWERLTIGSLAFLVVIAVGIIVLTVVEHAFDWHLLVERAVLTLPVAVLAGYSAHKAEQLRVVERASRRMALELASISPYLATMPPADQNEIKRALADRFFAQPQVLHADGGKQS